MDTFLPTLGLLAVLQPEQQTAKILLLGEMEKDCFASFVFHASQPREFCYLLPKLTIDQPNQPAVGSNVLSVTPPLSLVSNRLGWDSFLIYRVWVGDSKAESDTGKRGGCGKEVRKAEEGSRR